jgi:UDP-N-acetylglucosamine 2-epimerase (non-hydrolysing)
MSSVLPLIFSAGTAAELIKLYPVLKACEREGLSWRFCFTGQSPEGLLAQWRDFGFAESLISRLVHTERDLDNAKDAAFWFARAMLVRRGTWKQSASSRKKAGVWVVHGDTLSTVAGAVLGRRAGYQVAHVEAGLRSGTFRAPFPEEIARTIVGQLATLHFPPDPSAEHNLKRERARGRIVPTLGNTQLDAVATVLEETKPVDLPEGSYGLVNVHRYETLISAEKSNELKSILLHAASKHKLVVVAHETANTWAKADPGFLRSLENAGARWLPRQPFTRFAHWVANAHFVLADSGGNQQECSYLGVPCLLLRDVTETPIRRSNVILSRFRRDAIDAFLADPASYRLPRERIDEPPSTTIVRTLRESLLA